DLGTRTLMMDNGQIAVDIKGEERAKLDVDGLLKLYRETKGKALDNDRILLS
ncbi:MAG: ABC transporter ATP-binding protein, partial [Clostridia bacterium]|nr:ABC transporter ATP-binding protein [Clostridia bacterium]